MNLVVLIRTMFFRSRATMGSLTRLNFRADRTLVHPLQIMASSIKAMSYIPNRH